MIAVALGLLFAVPALAVGTGSLLIFAPDGRVLTRQEVTKIYEAAKNCEKKTSAALPELEQDATRGNETAKAALTVAHAFCVYRAIDDILILYPPEK